MTKSSSIARTAATAEGAMLPEILAWSSSLSLDRRMVREDLLGSAAHVTMLARTGLVSEADARVLRDALLAMLQSAIKGELELAEDEEDVHMAVEAQLSRELGEPASRLHTARSRNDQVSTDLHLYIRERGRLVLLELSRLIALLVERAKREENTILPAYTHRQRAQPISLAFLISAWCQSLLRAAKVLRFALTEGSLSPLGSGACSGTSLPIDRQLTARLLGFDGCTSNALDTVGDRDFAIDWCWAGARILTSLSRVATDVIDYASAEFGFIKIGDAIAAGSSMMPQKKNPDVFELVRGQSAHAAGHIATLLTLVKGLPTGYSRDLQEDRRIVLDTAPLVLGALRAVRLGLENVEFRPEACARAVADGSTQATDLAEALVRRGVPFRDAYRAVGRLVKVAAEAGVPLREVSVDVASTVHESFDANTLAALAPEKAILAKESAGGTGPRAVAAQLAEVQTGADELSNYAKALPTLESIGERLANEPLK